MQEAKRTMPPVARSLAWDDFRLIEAVVSARTLPAAATRLGLDHSTVFRRLRQIEAALGTPVFERHRSGYVLTAAGVEIAALASRVDEDITAVLRRVAGQSPSSAGEVRIATKDTLLFDLLMPLLAEFKRACPDVRLGLVTGQHRAEPVPPRRRRRCPRDVGAAGNAGGAQDRADCLGHLCDPPAPCAPGAGNRARLRRFRLGRLRGRAGGFGSFDTIGGLVAAIEAGIGTGLLPCFAGDRRASLMRLVPPIPSLTTDLWLLTHADLRQVPQVRVLLDFLGERMAALRFVIEGVG